MAVVGFIISCALLSRLHGGGFFPLSRFFRSLFFSLPFGLIHPALMPLAFIGNNIGHEDFWSMGTNIKSDPRENWLCKLVAKLPVKRDSLAWCWIGMGIKGFITLPFGGFIAKPLAYHIGRRYFKNSESAEYLSGAFYGILLIGLAFIRGHHG